MVAIQPRAVALNPYPASWRLPGDRTPRRQHLPAVHGVARRSIIHALTYHELPQKVDELIDAFPAESAFMTLNPLQRNYLSFTVYSLKQMVAAGTVSADTAWTLFYGEWDRMPEVEIENFIGLRQAFMQRVGAEVSDSQINSGDDLLQLEFMARAGAGGLAQFERYHEFAAKLVFANNTITGELPPPVKVEYCKALWLEMRIIESQVGLSRLNGGVTKFVLNQTGLYSEKPQRTIYASIDVFNNRAKAQSGSALDSTIKPEIGHWLFKPFVYDCYDWAAEVMDRMNIAAYTPRLAEIAAAQPVFDLPPEARAFLRGGFFLSSLCLEFKDQEAEYPTYPDRFPAALHRNTQDALIYRIQIFKHISAEYVEQAIRRRIINAIKRGELPGQDAYQIYRRMGIYVASLNYEEKSIMEIFDRIEAFDLAEIDQYFQRAGEGRYFKFRSLSSH